MTAQRLSVAAGILCRNPDFARFCRWLAGTAGLTFPDAATCVRAVCEVRSRAEIDTNPEAAQAFVTLRRGFTAWREMQHHRRAA
ncbi:hypothetical protein [Chitinasiproducens palmae]|uniref:Uncharacterized protein n=1 Tax=Chitinasiproducens palmae TaxID=1770053 RepID=A0A1H2PQS7_9BURK|nr:hypothetical protein [Chitinasiproducens palmae]SDV49212.1 hypothetical protein SAMN05216551_107155 [Chitinasiproducens palmae]